MTRLGAWLRRTIELAVAWLPYYPDPAATCPAHGRRYCRPCSRGARDCTSCDYGPGTGMHWDTCANRIRG